MPRAPFYEPATLKNRLRGIYRTPITDGLGPAGGEEPDNPLEHVHTFETVPIQHEAAAYIERLEAALALATGSNDSLGFPVYRHVKRGTEYTVLGQGELQMSADLVDGAELVIYRGDDGKIWFRETGEFHDGRFVKVDPA
ncbi:hypothetical protein [Roseococcus pinisoli]|uniref:Uncharacterized protein n=1 Tax=Roseococcus pinisoli TaxID=2835040 RepID=A0ABS5QFI8_9PROT|nr:hypothetical protein [Roseococcus pinisoli]MBS7812312.1 hypothetical protein [Roseococcus pinisoli]